MIFGMSVRDIRRQVGQLAIVGFNGHDGAGRGPADREGVRPRRRDLLRPQRCRSRAGDGDVARVAIAGARDPAVGERRPGGWTGRAPQAAVHRVAADDHARPARRTRRSRRRFAKALAAELHAVGISLDYTPVLDIFTNPKNSVIGDRALAERAEDVARLGVGDHPHAAERRASPRAASTFPVMATRRRTRTSSCPSSSMGRIAWRRSSSCRSRPRSRPTWPRS